MMGIGVPGLTGMGRGAFTAVGLVEPGPVLTVVGVGAGRGLLVVAVVVGVATAGRAVVVVAGGAAGADEAGAPNNVGHELYGLARRQTLAGFWAWSIAWRGSTIRRPDMVTPAGGAWLRLVPRLAI